MAGQDFSAELFGPSAGQDFSADLFGAKPTPEKQSAFRQVADVPLGIAKGAVQGVRMIADAFGAGSDTSNTIKSAETYLADLMSAQSKNDQQEISRIMKEAEDKGVLDQVKAGIKAFTVAPVDTLAGALGTAAPVIAGALGANILGAGALVGTGVSAALGAGMGAGVIKGSIYEETKRTLKDAGASEQDAEQRAQLAQEYGGKNLDQILLGTVLGGAAAVGPLEKGAAGILARRILGKAGAKEAAEETAKGAVRRRVEAGALEALPEMAQAGQEQVAQNIALQREGFDVPTFRGAVSSATLEGIAGGGLGAALGGGKPEVAPAPEAPPAAAPVVPPSVVPEAQTPEQVRQRVEEVTGVNRAAPPSAEESVLGRLYKLNDAEAEAAREELTQQRLLRQQEQIDAEANRIAELNRRQGITSPDRPKSEIEERPSIAEAPPELTPREELQAKQAEVDRLRLEAGLPTGEASATPGTQPTPEVVEEPKPAPKIVDNRPLAVRAAKNRLLVMQNMLQNQGGDPESLTVVPHPTVEGKFAIQSLDVPTKFTPNLPRTAITRPETPTIIDPVNSYVEIQRRTNTPAARRFVQEYEAGRITREDVERAIEQEQKAGRPQPLTYTATGAPGIVAPEISKPRGEREVPKLGETPTKFERPEEPPTEEPPGEEPPAPTATMPKTLEEFQSRMPIVFDKAEVREANNEGNFAKLTKALQLSSNPAIRRIGQLGAGIASKITLRKPGKLGMNVAGVYRYADDSIQMVGSHAGNEHTNAHETLHALISKAQRFPTDRQKPVVAQIDKLYEHVKKELKKKGVTAYGLTNAREFTAEAMTNPEFQFELMQIPYHGKKSSWTQFVKLVADLLGIQNTNALTEVMNLVDRLAMQKQPRKTVTDKELTDEMASPEEVKAAAIVKAKAEAPSPNILGKSTDPGQQAIAIVNSLGMGVKPPEPGVIDKAKKILKGENPDFTKESTKKSFQQLMDKIETMTFSADAAFNNELRRNLIRDMGENPEILGMMLEASQSQTVHADALASQFMIDGGLEYDNELKKWHSVKKPDTFIALANKIEEIAKKYGQSKEEMERIAHTYFVAKRLPEIIKRNEELDAEIKAEKATEKPDLKSIDKWKSLKVFVSPEQLAMVQPGLSLVDTIPELKQVVDIWQGIRQNNIDVLVNSGLWSPEYAQAMWDNIDYVPYYREEQIEEGAGPQEFIRGLQVKSKEFQLKGSGAAVNDVFDNMIRWSQSAMNRAIRAHKATQMIDVALTIDVGDRKMATKVTEEKRGMNIVRIFRDGKQELYDMADPLFVPAFSSIQNVSIPTLTFMSKLANVLRNSVVLYPMFSVAQVPQDSFAAMFSSGLKTQHALKIPFLAVKEFVSTLAKTSSTHKELVKFGVVGVRDFSATIVREDAEIYAGLKPPRGGWGKTKEFLSHIAMAADNAVRQAVYEASMQQGLNKSEALEKAFEIINFRRRGTSKMLNVMGQTVPFFYAYLSAQRVAYKTLTGVGISPTQRKEALTTLATTTAAVMTLSMLYAMANGDDEDYINTPAAVRDRTITIPGSGGVRIPLRPDFFLLPKLAAEHTYLLLTDKGYEDGAKFRTSVKDALVNAVASPLPVPQALKPLAEVAINYDFFQGKPILGQFEKNKDLGRQFNDSTSELSKLFGQTGLVSPIMMDHLVRGMLGSVGGLTLFATNQFLHSDPDVPRPELSVNEMLAALPGASGFLKRPQESALKNDFYVLRDEVEKAVNTFNDIKTRSPQGLQDFVENEKQMARLMLGKPVDKINRELAKIRKVVTQVTNMPEDQMSAEKKAEFVRQMREVEREILKSVNVKQLREMAKI